MFKVIKYRVQAWRLQRGVFVQAGHLETREEASALALGAAVSKSADGVEVVRIEGEPVFDLWREPVVLASYGSVPISGCG